MLFKYNIEDNGGPLSKKINLWTTELMVNSYSTNCARFSSQHKAFNFYSFNWIVKSSLHRTGGMIMSQYIVIYELAGAKKTSVLWDINN